MSLKKLKRGLKKAGKVLLGGMAIHALPTIAANAVGPAIIANAIKKSGSSGSAEPESGTPGPSPTPEAPKEEPKSNAPKPTPENITTGGASFYRTKEEEEDSNLAGTSGKSGTAVGFKKGGMVKKSSKMSKSSTKSSPARSVVGCAKRGFGKALMKGR